jgi:hypothetical protein
MRISSIRDKYKKKLNRERLDQLARDLENTVRAKGFESYAAVVNGSCINISASGRSFYINTKLLDYNAEWSCHTESDFKDGKSKKPFRRSITPTWEQRESFNHLINDVLDDYGISANIKSGQYQVRYKDSGRVNDWGSDPNYAKTFGYWKEVMPIKEAVWKMVELERELKAEAGPNLKVVGGV